MSALHSTWFPLGRRHPRVALLVATSLLGLTATVGVTAGPARAAAPAEGFRDGAVLVGFQDGTTAAAARAAEHAADPAAREKHVVGRTHVLTVPAGHVQEAVARLKRHGAVRFAEPDFLGELAATPNDPSFPQQWPLQNTGQSVGGTSGTAGADEQAAKAWAVTTGAPSVVVGVVDTGVDYNHPDLAAAVWRNPGGVNGCPKSSRGYNAITGACDPMDDDTVYNGHGTHVAGIIGATGNNGTGVTGVSWSTTVLPVKTVTGDGVGATSSLIAGLDWLVRAKQAGVNIRVVNDSQTWRGTAYSQALVDEIDVLGRNGILFVTAGGNTSDDNDDPALRRYPCGYNRSNVLCAAATTQSDTKASYANRGGTTVDLGAPGDNVYSTLRRGRYGSVSGSSMAAAEVTGTAALALAAQPGLSTLGLKAAILQGADRLPSLSGLVRTGARLNTCAAVAGCSSKSPSSQPFAVTAPGLTATGPAAPAPTQGSPVAATTGDWTGSPTSTSFQWQRCSSTGSACSPISGAQAGTYVPSSADVGATLQARVTATAAGGSATSASPPSMVVRAGTTSAQTFGVTSVGPNGDSMVADRKRVNVATLGVSGSVTSLTMYLAPTAVAGSQSITGVLYADASGAPGTLLARSSSLTFTSQSAAGWYGMAFASPVPLTAGRYWIGVQSGGTSGVTGFRWTSAAGSRAYNTDAASDGPSSPFGAATVDAEQMSVFATYR